MVNGIAHVALYTDCFDKSVEFYRNVFDAEEAGHPNTPRRGIFLNLGKDILEIFESEKMSEGMFKHIALSVSDVDGLYSKALSLGAEAFVEPKDIVLTLPEGDKTLRMAFIKGPSGEQIELLQFT